MTITRKHHLALTLLGVAGLVGLLTGAASSPQVVNSHAEEQIGTVREVYDGTLLPDIQVNTFRNIDRLFPTRTVRHGQHVYPLPVGNTRLGSVPFTSKGNVRPLDYLSLNRVSGLLVLKNGRIAPKPISWAAPSALDVDVGRESITATLIGAPSGWPLASIDDPVTRCLPG
jgi:hypothetical protein